MNRWIPAMVVGAVLALTTASAAQAQGRGAGQEKAKANGPAFCRSGEGHPVYGRAWCMEKGFPIGAQDWRRVDAGRIRIEPTREPDRAGGLLDILGDILLDRFETQRRTLAATEPLSVRWLVPDDGPRVLQVWAGGLAVGELVDNDRDGTVDLAVMRFGR